MFQPTRSQQTRHSRQVTAGRQAGHTTHTMTARRVTIGRCGGGAALSQPYPSHIATCGAIKVTPLCQELCEGLHQEPLPGLDCNSATEHCMI